MFLPLEFIADALDGDGNVDTKTEMEKFDLTGDGRIDASDCPFPGGSVEAKLWWRNILEPSITQDIPDELTEKYGDRIVGVYKGKPLVPGEAGPGQGDFQLLIDKIKITQGLSHTSAVKIAAKVKHMMYGG